MMIILLHTSHRPEGKSSDLPLENGHQPKDDADKSAVQKRGRHQAQVLQTDDFANFKPVCDVL